MSLKIFMKKMLSVTGLTALSALKAKVSDFYGFTASSIVSELDGSMEVVDSGRPNGFRQIIMPDKYLADYGQIRIEKLLKQYCYEVVGDALLAHFLNMRVEERWVNGHSSHYSAINPFPGVQKCFVSWKRNSCDNTKSYLIVCEADKVVYVIKTTFDCTTADQPKVACSDVVSYDIRRKVAQGYELGWNGSFCRKAKLQYHNGDIPHWTTKEWNFGSIRNIDIPFFKPRDEELRNFRYITYGKDRYAQFTEKYRGEDVEYGKSIRVTYNPKPLKNNDSKVPKCMRDMIENHIREVINKDLEY